MDDSRDARLLLCRVGRRTEGSAARICCASRMFWYSFDHSEIHEPMGYGRNAQVILNEAGLGIREVRDLSPVRRQLQRNLELIVSLYEKSPEIACGRPFGWSGWTLVRSGTVRPMSLQAARRHDRAAAPTTGTAGASSARPRDGDPLLCVCVMSESQVEAEEQTCAMAGKA